MAQAAAPAASLPAALREGADRHQPGRLQSTPAPQQPPAFCAANDKSHAPPRVPMRAHQLLDRIARLRADPLRQ